VDNPELEQLEATIGQFNLFEAIGAVRMELRHSDFLAYLLDPAQNHGLGDLFLKRLLQKILASTDRAPKGFRPIHVDILDLSKTSVRREWENVDILCVNEDSQLAVLIENKIGSGERKGQLKEYLHAVRQTHAGFTIIPIFLTPDGNEPLDASDDQYICVPYSLICDTLSFLLDTRRSMMGPDVFTTINHYVEMLRRHIVSDSEIAKLVRQIYGKHRKALDLIFEHRPDEQFEWSRRLEGMVRADARLYLDHCSKDYVRFIPKEWNTISELNKGQGWTPTKRILLFQFNNFPPDEANLNLYIGPSAAGAEDVRQTIFDASKANGTIFKGTPKARLVKWTPIWSQGILSPKDFETLTEQEQIEKAQREWERFLADDLRGLTAAVNAIFER
jgi:hypothetical protein